MKTYHRPAYTAASVNPVNCFGVLTLVATVFLLSLALVPIQKSWAGDSDEFKRPPAHGQNTELDQAMKECMESVGTVDNGRPDMDAMDECMSAKGFEKPDGPPPGRPGGHTFDPNSE